MGQTLAVSCHSVSAALQRCTSAVGFVRCSGQGAGRRCIEVLSTVTSLGPQLSCVLTHQHEEEALASGTELHGCELTSARWAYDRPDMSRRRIAGHATRAAHETPRIDRPRVPVDKGQRTDTRSASRRRGEPDI